MPQKIELQPNQKILFIGDSITDAGHNEPYYRPFGFGYVHFAANFLRTTSSGLGGSTF